MDAIIAGIVISAYISVAFGCFHITASRSSVRTQRHPLTVIMLTGVAFLLLWEAFQMLPYQAVAEPVIVNLEIKNQAIIESISSENQQITNAQAVQTVPVWPSIAQWQAVIEQAATACGVDSLLIAAVMRQESAGNPTICSTAGACGLMQLMPSTAAQLGVVDRFDPVQNVHGGACYLRQQLNRYGNDLTLALAAYNAGPGNVDKYGGVPPYAETQKYVRNVSAFYAQLTQPAQPAQPQPVASSDNRLIWPVSGRITQQPSQAHMALDIAAPLGTPVVSVYAGRVSAVGWAGDYGKRIMIEHGNGTQTLYAHLSSFTVREGEQVNQNQMIGRIGSTGRSTGPHLHFEVRQNGVRQNPWNYLRTTQAWRGN